MVIGPNGNLTDVKGEHQLVFGYRNCRIWFEGVTNAKLIKRIRVVRGNVSNHNVGVQQLLIHRDIDVAGVLNLVRPNTFVSGSLSRWFDDVLVGLIQIEDSASRVIGLLPKSHHDETCRHTRETTTGVGRMALRDGGRITNYTRRSHGDKRQLHA